MRGVTQHAPIIILLTPLLRLTLFPCSVVEVEAKKACEWLRATGFPQYAQLFEGGSLPFPHSQTFLIPPLFICKMRQIRFFLGVHRKRGILAPLLVLQPPPCRRLHLMALASSHRLRCCPGVKMPCFDHGLRMPVTWVRCEGRPLAALPSPHLPGGLISWFSFVSPFPLASFILAVSTSPLTVSASQG